MFNPASFLKKLKSQTFYDRQIVHCRDIPPRAAKYGVLDVPLDAKIEAALKRHRLGGLYAHQTEAVNRTRAGGNVIVATSAASGKSMCYNLPVMQAMTDDPHACALYLFPTKALAQNQIGKIRHFFSPDILAPDEFDTFDGDTPREARAAIRNKARLIITNPDMLHVSILPNHRQWARLWKHLRYIVVDEAHAYRGVFGSHVALILRRLRRLCAVYGTVPQFILASATIENPEEHACNLIGLPFAVITDDGSPRGGRDFVLWNPPVVDKVKGTRRSANSEASNLLALLVSEGIRSICFARTRRLAELLANYTRDRLAELKPEYVKRVKTYRAGYLPAERRRLEQELEAGHLIGVVATNALELGVDIGGLDASVLTGYPGTIASTWQQAGRSGRREGRSLSFLIGLDNPLDQYLMRNPDFIFGSGFENALVNPANHHILRGHLLCAAWELALAPGDRQFFGDTLKDELDGLAGEELMREKQGKYYLSPSISYPAGDVDVRSVSGDNFTLHDAGSGRLLENLDAGHAFSQAHLGAVYLHQGESYTVTEFDLAAKTIKAEVAPAAWYTVARELTDVRIIGTHAKKDAGSVMVFLGEVEVSVEVVSYRMKAQFTEEVLGEVTLDLPIRRFRTVALWFDIPLNTTKKIADKRLDFTGGLHGAEHAAIGMLPLFAMCDRNDIGGLSTPLHPDTSKPQIFIYDGHQGGVGIAEKGYEIIRELWRTALATIAGCRCRDGCPSCIQSPKCGNNNKPLDKRATRLLLEGLLGRNR
ncbi:MAG: DEAD/DEAH box helicase [Dehalococcoidia bacterium]|nr:DEAD/DEAH box helicase [Dehalococcoidia bacterium]